MTTTTSSPARPRSVAHGALLPLALLVLVASAPPQNASVARPLFAEPSLSSDASEVVFTSGGDIWSVPARGGEARLLVSHPAYEYRPLLSPDGQELAFASTRTGAGDIYVLTLRTGTLRRLTFDEIPESPDAWSSDGQWIYFSISSHDISGMLDVHRVRASGGTPMPVAADRYATEFWAAPSADGKSVAITARGTTAGQWWRRGHSHLDESEIWLVHDGSTPRYEGLVMGDGAKRLWPMWGSDGRTLYYMSDEGGAENIWKRNPDGRRERLTNYRDGRVVWPQIARNGSAIVFERDYRIYLLDVSSGTPREVPITLRGAPAVPGVERLTVNNAQLQEAALSPDGRKVAYIVRGEIFAASAKDGGDGFRVTRTAAREVQMEWSPDSRRLAYVSDRDGVAAVYMYDFGTNTESRVTQSAAGDVGPRFSPDGKRLVVERGSRELVVVDVASKAERVVAQGTLDRLPFLSSRSTTWSPDGRWIAYLSVTGKQFSAVHIVPADGGEARQVSFLPNVFGGTVLWSPDGTYLLFDTSQRTEPGQLARIDLVPRTPRFREDQFTDLFRDNTPRPTPARDTTRATPDSVARDSTRTAARPPINVVWADIRKRLSLVPVGVDVQGLSISPDGKMLLLTAGAAGQQNLYTWPMDELSREEPVARQLTSTSGGKGFARFSPDGKDVLYLEGGRLMSVTVESRQARPVAVTAEMDVDFTAEKATVMRQAWQYLRDNFHDPRMNGTDWNAVRDHFAPLAAGARMPDELRRAMSLMVGELNASHLGIGAPPGAVPGPVGRIGLTFNRDVYESTGRLQIERVIPLSPAAVAGVPVGATLVRLNGVTLDRSTNIDSVLANTIGRRVTLGIDGAPGRPREYALRPVNLATEKGLLYRAWVEERRDYVAKASNGRLGYVHLADMSAQTLAQLNIDLDTEMHGREGVVIDVRNNNGGFVNAYALDIFTRRGYMTMTYRDGRPAPARTVLGQRALELPTVLVTNQHSLSDAEDFTEGYRTLGLGKVVGEPTAGWIIYTSNSSLLDGSTVRLPFITIRGANGEIMEMKPRPVDVPVERPIGESYSTKDSQLDRAVAVLLAQLGTKTSSLRP